MQNYGGRIIKAIELVAPTSWVGTILIIVLIGLPPTPEEVTTFLEACERESGSSDHVGERAYEELIDRLLASPHYGEQWGRHWLDVIRFGESTGFERNVIINNAWPFRNYIIKSLNEDKPFDQLLRDAIRRFSWQP